MDGRRCPALEDWWVTLAPHNEEAHGLLVERYNEMATLPETVHEGETDAHVALPSHRREAER
jgi:hypothetical protein